MNNKLTVSLTWVPVGESLPAIKKGFGKYIAVLIAFGNEPEAGEALYCSDGYFSWGYDEPPIERVTHWMPLPAAPQEPTKCWCHTCRPVTMFDMRFVVCPECGNKRCPHANDHRHACSGSNKPGQEGSAYPEKQEPTK